MASVVSSANEQESESNCHERDPAYVARRILLNGGVQGLGVRPAIFRLAAELEVAGSVRNSSRGVEIEIEGSDDAVGEFECQLLGVLPRAALVSQLKSEAIQTSGRRGFSIVKDLAHKRLHAHVPADRGLCADCAREIEQAHERRQRYPFTSCTQCGPRYTVIRRMPFERNDTAMDRFPLCAACRTEYERVGDRRFHAQTTACPVCGPHISLNTDTSGFRLDREQAFAAATNCCASG